MVTSTGFSKMLWNSSMRNWMNSVESWGSRWFSRNGDLLLECSMMLWMSGAGLTMVPGGLV